MLWLFDPLCGRLQSSCVGKPLPGPSPISSHCVIPHNSLVSQQSSAFLPSLHIMTSSAIPLLFTQCYLLPLLISSYHVVFKISRDHLPIHVLWLVLQSLVSACNTPHWMPNSGQPWQLFTCALCSNISIGYCGNVNWPHNAFCVYDLWVCVWTHFYLYTRDS